MSEPRHTPARWPGLDGVVLIVLVALALLLQSVRELGGLGWGVVLACVAVGVYLLLTRAARRRQRPALPAPRELRVLVVIPTHNNAGSIASVVRGALEHHRDVVVIDDGSTDRSGELAAQAGAHVVTHPVNRGKGAALDTALEHAAREGFSHILTIDADDQHDPDEIPRFLRAVREHPDAILAGCRDMTKAPSTSQFARRNSNFWVWVETGVWVGDTQCGYRVYPVFPVRRLNLYPSRYEWEVEVLTRGLWSGIPVVDLPCRVYYPPADERVSSYRKVVDTARVTWVNTALVVERILWPPHWLRPTGARSWRDGHRGGVWGWRLLELILRIVGRRLMHLVVLPVAAFYWLLSASHRRGAMAYLRRRYPDASTLRRSWLALRIFVQFARSLVDRFVALQQGAEALRIDNSAVSPEKRAELYGGGLIVVSAHMGNPDLGSMSLQARGRRPVHVIAYTAPDDPYVVLMERYLGERAPRFIPLSGGENHASIVAARALDDGDIVALKGDRVTGGRTVEVSLLGAPARLPAGPLLLAAVTGAPVVVIGCFLQADGSYRVHLDGPRRYAFESRRTRARDLQQWGQQLADVLGEWAEQYPLQWYNFHDMWEEAEAVAPTEGSPREATSG